MEAEQPSIFNDVIGPVMRGPSSSHCAASVRIGLLARALMGAEFEQVLVEFDRLGSLATTHESQGSDMGLVGGLLGWELTDERLLSYREGALAAGLQVRIEITDFDTDSPNTYKLTLRGRTGRHQMVAHSVGGGMIQIVEIDRVPVALDGSRHESLIFLPQALAREPAAVEELRAFLAASSACDELLLRRRKAQTIPRPTKGDRLLGEGAEALFQLRGPAFLTPDERARLRERFGIEGCVELPPVLPVQGRSGIVLPFSTCEQMLEYNRERGLALWELAVHYESVRGSLSEEQVFAEMRRIVTIMRDAIETGILGTRFADRILACQTPAYHAKMESGSLLDGGMLNLMILHVSAMMEVKSSMGVIVAAPTAGACAGLPAAVIAAAQHQGLALDDMTRAMLAAGMIGIFIATHSTFAAEVGGCQAECGAGSGMAAAALVTMAGGTSRQAVGAASMALQNTLGLICDPVAGRVEVPCLGRNVLAASNALACANMALAGFDEVIPLDEVIDAMDRIGRSMPCELRCTCLGGLSTTATSKAVEQQLRSGCGSGCSKGASAPATSPAVSRGAQC